ncbi:unnamed protein product [Auanema sp. JU1783]|nr:unnamed protein product [Auanema sp. JU1783]
MVQDKAKEQQTLSKPDNEQPKLSKDKEKAIVRKEGFDYFPVTFQLTKTQKFGLGITDYKNMVIVNKVEENSMVAGELKVLDLIVDINGVPVSDKDICKTLIIKTLQNNKTVDLVIGRPVTESAKQTMENALESSQVQPPSVEVASDVRDIMCRFQTKILDQSNATKGILINEKTNPVGNVRITEENPKTAKIGNDCKGVALQKVPRPTESKKAVEKK